jgi:hypothetical protein
VSKWSFICLESLNELFYQYEEGNLKTYAGTKYDNFLLFKHPQKAEVKETLENIVTLITIP